MDPRISYSDPKSLAGKSPKKSTPVSQSGGHVIIFFFFFFSLANIIQRGSTCWGQIIKPTWDMAHVFFPRGIHHLLLLQPAAAEDISDEKNHFRTPQLLQASDESKYTTFISLEKALRLEEWGAFWKKIENGERPMRLSPLHSFFSSLPQWDKMQWNEISQWSK